MCDAWPSSAAQRSGWMRQKHSNVFASSCDSAFRPTIGPDDIRAVTEVMWSGHLAEGEKVRQFEEELAAHLGRRGVATNSGTSALHLAS